MGPIQRRVVKASLRSVRHPWWTLGIAGVALVVSIVLALTRLDISSDQNELFSKKEAYFRDYLKFSDLFTENEAIYVVLQKKDPRAEVSLDRWEEAVEAVVGKVSGLTKYVKLPVEYQAAGSRMGKAGILFDDPELVREHRKEVDEFSDLVEKVAGKAGMDSLVLGTSPAERYFRSIELSAAVKPTRFPQTAGITAEMVRSLGRTMTGGGAVAPDLARVGNSPRDMGYFYEKDQLDKQNKVPDGESRYLLMVRVYEKRDYTSLTAISETVEAIRTAAEEALPRERFPEFTVSLTGRAVLEADEMRISEHDTRLSEIAAGIAVFVGLILFLLPWGELRTARGWGDRGKIALRGLWLALVAELALGVGIGWTFGWATLTVGRLNLLSLVFVIALIGIGMDYLIQILTRYRREVMRYERATAVWARVFRYVSPPISTACLGAAGAFMVSVLTPFRGAAELGIIAGGGLVLCLLAGYTVLPAILTLWPPGLRMKDVAERFGEEEQEGGGAGHWRLVLPAAWIGAVALMVPAMMRVSFDPNLLNLQAANLPSVEMVRHLETWYAVVMSEDLGELRKVEGAIKGSPVVGRMDSMLDRDDNAAYLAGEAGKLPKIDWVKAEEVKAVDEGQVEGLIGTMRKLAGLYRNVGGKEAVATAGALEKLAGAMEKDKKQAVLAVSMWQWGLVAAMREGVENFSPPKLEIEKVPAEVRSHYVWLPEGVAGTMPASGAAAATSGAGRPIYVLYIYPNEDLWDQEKLGAFVADIERRVTPLQTGAVNADGTGDTRNFVFTGIAPELYHTTEAIKHSFFMATLYALILIFVLVLLDLRSITQTLVAISVLALGLPMLMGLMGVLGPVLGEYSYLVRFNMANFFGLPILIGAGHEYGVFMVHRYREALHNRRRTWRRWDVSDRALLLCGYVTCLAFAFLLLGRHRGMQSLGFVMAAGIGCIYLATICVVRPMLIWRLGRKRAAGEKR